MTVRSRLLAAALLPVVLACGKAASEALTDGGPEGSSGSTSSSGGGGSTSGGAGDDTGSNQTSGDGGSGSSSGGRFGEASAGVVCPSSSLAAGDYPETFLTDAGARTYQIHVPAGLDLTKPAPLVFAFHGGGQNAWQFEGFTHIHAKSDSAGFVLVEADGTPALGPSPLPPPSPDAGVVLDVWNAGNCCEYAGQLTGFWGSGANVDDVGFVGAMIDSVEKQICIDPKRVFATGFSNGGMLSHRLACQMSDRIASIVAVSGGSGATEYSSVNGALTPGQALYDCNPSRKVPVLHIHGTQDACYPFDGGYGTLSAVWFEPVDVTVQNWVKRNGCGTGSPTTVLTNGAATCHLYPCPKEGEVEFCTIDGGGHYWPGGDDWGGSTVFCGSGQGVRSADIIANDAFWSWFMAHPIP